MSLLKPGPLTGVNSSHALAANITAFWDIGGSDTDLVSTSAITTPAAQVDDAEIGPCREFTQANAGFTQTLGLVGEGSVLLIYHAQGAASGTPDSTTLFFDLNESGNLFFLQETGYSGYDLELRLKVGFSTRRDYLYQPYGQDATLHGAPKALAAHITQGIPKLYQNGAALTEISSEVAGAGTYSGTYQVPVMSGIGPTGTVRVGGIIVFDRILTDQEMADVTNDPWALATYAAEPSVTVTQATLTPGGTISGTYADYTTVPTTLTVSDGTNTITIPTPTINDTNKTFSGTMPSLPATGSASLILFTNSATVELT